jgi:hypothetical protein
MEIMSDDYTGIILEEIRDQNKAVLEAVGALKQQLTLTAKQSDLEEVKADIKTIKLAVTETNKQVRNHEVRLTHLEVA